MSIDSQTSPEDSPDSRKSGSRSPPAHLHRIAIVGRPNVGKSALFNRLSDDRRSLIHNMPGVTRDRLYGTVTWEGITFEVVDTGGLEPGADEPLKASMERQVAIAIDEAQVIMMVCDGRDGVTDLDRHIADLLRRAEKPIVLAVNKIDTSVQEPLISEFFELGLDEPIGVSAAHGTNSGDLVSRLVECLQDAPDIVASQSEEAAFSLTVVGKPNAGKSTLVNSLLGEDRMLVDSSPGTTRDSVSVEFTFQDKSYILVDTAGLRRKARIQNPVEKLAASASVRSIRAAEITVLLLDTTREFDAQDQRIAGLIQEAKRPCVVAINKWDTIEQKQAGRKLWLDILERNLHFLSFCPKVFISGLTGTNLKRLMATVDAVAKTRRMYTSTHRLTEMVREATLLHTPPMRGGKRLAIYYVTQLKNCTGTFVFKVNNPKLVDEQYRRYIENIFRKYLGYEGIPLAFVFRSDKGKRIGGKSTVARSTTVRRAPKQAGRPSAAKKTRPRGKKKEARRG